MSEWTTDPGNVHFLIVAMQTGASLLFTTTIAHFLCLVLSCIPTTQSPATRRPPLHFLLANFDSSTSTMIGSPFSSCPPSLMPSPSAVLSIIWATICLNILCHLAAVIASHCSMIAAVLERTLFNHSHMQCINSCFGTLQLWNIDSLNVERSHSTPGLHAQLHLSHWAISSPSLFNDFVTLVLHL